MNCFSVQILEIPLGTPSHFLTNGLLFLDLFEGTSSPVSIKAPALRFGKISDTAALGFAVPKTEKNKYLLQHFTNPAVSRGQAESLQVVAMQGGEALRQDRLQVVGGSHRRGEKKYEIQLLRSASHWITGAQNLLLSDLDLGTLNFSTQTVKSVQANNSVYNATNANNGVYLPAVHYGKFLKKFDHKVEDFRVWHHVTAIVEKGLCALGWGLDSPILYSDFGRRIISYLADSDYGSSENVRTSREYRATIDQQNPTIGIPNFPAGSTYLIGSNVYFPFLFSGESFDNGDNYNAATGFYTGIGTHDFTAAFNIEGNSDTAQQDKVTVEIIKRETDGSDLVVKADSVFMPVGSAPSDVSIEVTASQITLAPGESVYCAVYTNGFTNTNQSGAQITSIQGAFFNETTRTNYIAGDLIQLGDTIDPKMTFLEFLKGVVHLFNFRIDTNFNTKQVGLFPPFSVKGFNGNDYLGFYRELSQAVDYSDLVECESAISELEELSRKRYYSLRYADNSDGYITKILGEERGKELYAKTIDFGERYLPETEVDENPLFAASLSSEVSRTVNPNRQALDMLHLWEDENPEEQSFDVGFRVALAFGDKNVRKVMPDGSLGIPGFRFDGVESPIPYAAMRTDYVTASGTPLLQNLIYGEDLKTNNDLYSWFYKKDIVSRFNNLKISLRLFLNADKLAAFSIRNFAYLVADGVPFFARAEEVIDADRCSDLATEIIWIPEAALLDECVEDYDLPVGRCTDNPTVQVATTQSQTERCATPTIGGEQGATSSEVLEYSTDGGETWTPTTPGAQVCFSTDQQTALFRYTAQYQKGECRSRSVVEFVNFGSDCNNLPEISVTYDAPTNSISAVGSGTIGSSISNEVWTVTVGGGTSQTYAPGDVISNIGLQTVTFTRALVFADSCPDEVVTASYTPVPPECGNNPTIICNENGGFLTFTVGGLHVSEIYGIDFLVSEGGGDFVPWYGDPIACGDDVTVRAIVTYCDTCPPVCIEKVCECVNCESTFVFGQPAQFSVCG